MVLNATFNNISDVSWLSVLLVEKTYFITGNNRQTHSRLSLPLPSEMNLSFNNNYII